MNHSPKDSQSLRVVTSDPDHRPELFDLGADDSHQRPGLGAIVPSWLLSLVLHAGLFAVLAVSLPGLRGGIVGDPDGDLRSVGIWVGHSGDGTDGDGGGHGPTHAATGDTKFVPIDTSAPQALPPATPITQPPVKNALPDVSASIVPAPIIPAPLMPTPPVAVATGASHAPSSVPASPIIGPGPSPERAGLFQAYSQPRSSDGKPGLAGSGGGRRGSRGTTPFFGIVDVGSRFVYVIDCSGSMYSHDAMGAAKRELLRSLHTLNRFQQFQIVFYDTEQRWLKVPGNVDFRYFAADEKNLRHAAEFSAEIEPNGGTVHLAALELALRLHPDVVFFLTDGGKPGLSPSDLQELKRLDGRRTRIHCVQFRSEDDPDAALATDFLRKLADQNDGQYVCRDVSRFDAPSTARKLDRSSGEEH
jgi:hypothetical protein